MTFCIELSLNPFKIRVPSESMKALAFAIALSQSLQDQGTVRT